MAEKSPLVFSEGGFSQLPPGDSLEGVSLGSLTAGSGLVGGGDLNTGDKRLDVALASNASGVIFVGDSIGLDGVAQATADSALASGNAGLVVGETALSSGVVAQGEAAIALASGNAALDAAVNFVGSSSLELTAASPIGIGSAVGLDDTGSVQSVREVTDPDTRTFGSPVIFESANSNYISATYDSTNNRVVIVYRDSGNSSYGTAIVGTVSGTSISFGTAVVFESASSTYISATYDSTNDRVVIAYKDSGNSSYGTAIVGTVSGTSISFGTAVVFESADTDYIGIAYDSTNDRVVIAYRDAGSSIYGNAIVGTVSGTSISFGTAVVFESADSRYISSTYDSTNDRVVIAYRDDGNSSYGTAIVGTVSGTSISFGTAVVFDSANSMYISATYDSTNNRVVIAYRDVGNSSYGTAIVGTVSGTSISFGSDVVFESASSTYISATYDSTNDRVVIAYRDAGNSDYGTAIVAAPDSAVVPTLSSQNNFIGVAQATVASGSSVNVLLPRGLDVNQTGLTPGYFYYVDPTVSGFTSASGQPTTWSGAFNWAPVAKAVSSSSLLILDTI